MKTQTMHLLKGSGLTMSNSDQMAAISTTIVGLCGYLMLAIPYISRGIFTSMSGTFTQAAQYLGSSLHGSVSSAASPVALGNEAVGVGSVNNFSANKFDANRMHYEGASSINTANNSIMTRTPEGGTVLNTSSATSMLPMGFNLNHAERQSISNDQQKLSSLAESQSRSITTGINAATSTMDQYGKQLSSNESYNMGTQSSEDARASSAFTHLQSNIHDFAKSQNISDSQAWALVLGARAHANLNDPGFVKSLTGVNIGAGIHGDGSHNSNWSSTTSSAEKFAANNHDSINQDLSAIKSANLSSSTSDGHSSGINTLHQMQSNLSNLDNATRNYQSTLTQSDQLSQRADALKSMSADQNVNEAQAYQNFIQKHYPEKSAELFDPNNAQLMQANAPYVSEFIKAEGLSPQVSSLSINPNQSYQAGESGFNASSSAIRNVTEGFGQSLHTEDSTMYNANRNANMVSANQVTYQHLLQNHTQKISEGQVVHQKLQSNISSGVHGEHTHPDVSISGVKKAMKDEV